MGGNCPGGSCLRGIIQEQLSGERGVKIRGVIVLEGISWG